MCLIARSKELIAKKDIPCYKVLKRTLYSGLLTPYMSKSVRIGQVMDIRYFGRRASYFSETIAIDEGIHAYTSKKRALSVCSPFCERIIVRTIIPKGTPYYLGTRQDIVALKMKLKKIIYKKGKWLK